MLDWMGAEAAVKPVALAYMQIISAGILFFIGRFLLWAVFQAWETTGPPTRYTGQCPQYCRQLYLHLRMGTYTPFGRQRGHGTVLALTTSASWLFS